MSEEKKDQTGYQERTYRRLHNTPDLICFNITVGESDLHIRAETAFADEDVLKKRALESLLRHRRRLKAYDDPLFFSSLVPVELAEGAPYIAVRMADAAKKAGVGPMAAVAGAIAELVGLDLVELSPNLIIENGGDIFIASKIPRVISIYSGNSPFSGRIGLNIYPEMTPVGVCTSAGTVGHSLSFGKADAVTIISKDTALADAVATGAGNLVKSSDDIEAAIEYARGIPGVEGIVVIIGDKLGAWGKVEFVKI